MNNEVTWIVVTNGGTARLFQLQSGHHLDEFEKLDHPESRFKNSNLVSDRPGRDFESDKKGTRHAMEPKTTPKEQEALEFAHTLTTYLQKAHQEGRFQKLYLAAGPSWIGILRKIFTPSLLKAISNELTKDLVLLPKEEIAQHFGWTPSRPYSKHT